jgi:hypothetical protein
MFVLVASQAELDHFHYLRKQTAARVLRSCSGEMEREVHAILGPMGVKEALSRLVAEDLRIVEEDVWGDRVVEGDGTEGVMGAATSGLKPKVEKGEKKKSWGVWNWGKGSGDVVEEDGGAKGNEEMGMTAFLLKFGEGLGGLSSWYIRVVGELIHRCRGGTPVEIVHLGIHHWLFILHRWSHSTHTVYGYE